MVTEEPVPAGEKRLTVRRGDTPPRLDLLFHTPGYPHADLHALDILEGVLSGKSGRLHKKLVDTLKLPALHSPLWAPDAEAVISTATEAMTVATLDILKKG